MVRKNYNPKTLEKVERYRKLLLTSPTIAQIKKELNLRNKRAYDYLMAAYKDIYNNEEVKQSRLSEILEKLSVVERKSFNDYLKGAIKSKEYTDVMEYYLKQLAKFGLAPDEISKIEVNVSGGLDITTKMKGIEAYFKDLEDKKKKGLL